MIDPPKTDRLIRCSSRFVLLLNIETVSSLHWKRKRISSQSAQRLGGCLRRSRSLPGLANSGPRFHGLQQGRLSRLDVSNTYTEDDSVRSGCRDRDSEGLILGDVAASDPVRKVQCGRQISRIYLVNCDLASFVVSSG